MSDRFEEHPQQRPETAREGAARERDPARRAAILRARRRRRLAVLTVFQALVAGAFMLTLMLLLSDAWPEIPFPQANGLAIVGMTGLVFGLVLGHWRALALTLVVLPVGALLAAGGIWSGVVALAVAGPYAAAGLVVGIGTSRGVRALARRRRAATSRRSAPRAEAPTPAH